MKKHRSKIDSVKLLAASTADKYGTDQLSTLSAALAYYTVFSLAPLLLIAIGIAGLIFHGSSAQNEIFGQIRGFVGDQGAAAIQSLVQNFSRSKSSNIWATIIGIIVLIYGASEVFSQLQTSLNIIWRVPYKKISGLKNFIRQRLLTFAMVLGVGFLMTVSLLVSAFLSGAIKYASGLFSGTPFMWQAVNFGTTFLIDAVLFALIFKVIPDAPVKWKYVWPGALLTSFLFSVGKTLIGLYLGKSSVSSSYGAAGSVVIVLLWVYYASQILYVGAAFTYSYTKLKIKGYVPPETKPEMPTSLGNLEPT